MFKFYGNEISISQHIVYNTRVFSVYLAF